MKIRFEYVTKPSSRLVRQNKTNNPANVFLFPSHNKIFPAPLHNILEEKYGNKGKTFYVYCTTY